MGQVNRVDSARLAVARAGKNVLLQPWPPLMPSSRSRRPRGASRRRRPAVVQPGGSVRDEEVIAAARAAGATMYFTGVPLLPLTPRVPRRCWPSCANAASLPIPRRENSNRATLVEVRSGSTAPMEESGAWQPPSSTANRPQPTSAPNWPNGLLNSRRRGHAGTRHGTRGDDPGSQAYVAGKHRDCAEVGINSIPRRPAVHGDPGRGRGGAEEPERGPRLHRLHRPAAVACRTGPGSGLAAIDPAKDADGLHPMSLGQLVSMAQPRCPARPAASSGIVAPLRGPHRRQNTSW